MVLRSGPNETMSLVVENACPRCWWMSVEYLSSSASSKYQTVDLFIAAIDHNSIGSHQVAQSLARISRQRRLLEIDKEADQPRYRLDHASVSLRYLYSLLEQWRPFNVS